jgi:hypothetical protein
MQRMNYGPEKDQTSRGSDKVKPTRAKHGYSAEVLSEIVHNPTGVDNSLASRGSCNGPGASSASTIVIEGHIE